MIIRFIFSILWIPLFSFSQAVFPELPSEEDRGFVTIFDGRSLDGWDGDPTYWSLEDGRIVGEVTPETLLERNSFLIWRGGKPSNFELKLEYRISAKGNSGINYRSSEVPDVPWALKGYQSDIDGEGQWNGQNYEERGRTFLALRGQITRTGESRVPAIIGSTGDRDILQSFIHKEDWNECHLIIQDNTLIHMINGHVMSIVIDDDKKARSRKGLIGVQVHVGPPMKVEYRNIRLKEL